MITLGVNELERSILFYEQGLGLPRMASPPEVAFFTLNGTWLGLFGRESLAKDAGVSATGSGFSGFSLAHNVASEAEVDAVLQQAVAAGASLVKPGQKVFWATLPTLTATCGRWRIIRISGWVLKTSHRRVLPISDARSFMKAAIKENPGVAGVHQ